MISQFQVNFVQVHQSETKSRGEHVKGGLYNAVKQAEDRGFYDMFIFDSDCHVQEPFRYLAEKYLKKEHRDLLFAKDSDDKFALRDSEISPQKNIALYNKQLLSEYNPISGYSKIGGGRMAAPILDGRPEQSDTLGKGRVKRPEEARPEGPEYIDKTVERFTGRMREIGIKGSAIFPGQLLHLARDPRPADFKFEVGKAFTMFMLDNYLGKYPEMKSFIYADGNSPEKQAELIDDVGNEKGIVGVFVPGLTPLFPGEDEWNPIYEAAQKKNLPICVHSEVWHGGEFFERFDKTLGMHALAFPFIIVRQVTSIVLEGVPERYPHLKFVFVEGGVTWIPWLMQRLDDDYTKRRYEAPLLKKLPSEYMKQFYFTTQPLEQQHPDMLEYTFKTFDSENHLIYASDYPHWDFDVPSVIYDLAFLSDTAKRKILGENAKKVFKMS
jgi:uncharacterized protein